ncbi:MAG: hypothetical protein V3S14_13520 [Anaerolineae bacterium]
MHLAYFLSANVHTCPLAPAAHDSASEHPPHPPAHAPPTRFKYPICPKSSSIASPSVGVVSNSRAKSATRRAGRRAGEILDEIDYSPLGDIVLARDETYFNDLAFLIGVEPRTYVLLAGQVEEGCDGEMWGVSADCPNPTLSTRTEKGCKSRAWPRT